MRSQTHSRVLALLTLAALLGACSRHPASSLLAPASRVSVERARATAGIIGDDAGLQAHAPADSTSLPPSVAIVSPTPNHLLSPTLPTAFTIRVAGSDPDARTARPLEFRYHLFSDNDPSFSLFAVLIDPDSVLRRFGPTFAGWSRLKGEQGEVELSGLTPYARYVFMVIAIDEQGNPSRVASFDLNMLYFNVAPPQVIGPALTVSGDISAGFLRGGIQDDPATAPKFAIPFDHASSIHWRSLATFGDVVTGYRWALDPSPVDVPGSGNARAGSWSAWSLAETTAVVGPFAATGEHRLYVEARTQVGMFSRTLLLLDAVATAPAPRAARE